MRNRKQVRWLFIFSFIVLIAVAVLFLSPIRERVTWRISNWRAQVQRSLNPPQEIVFVPEGQSSLAATDSPEQGFADLTLTPSSVEALQATTLAIQITPTVMPEPSATFSKRYADFNSHAITFGCFINGYCARIPAV